MVGQKESSVISRNKATECRQAQKICHGCPALLNIMLEQPIGRDYSPNMFVVLQETPLALLAIVVFPVAKMMPNEFVMSTPGTAEGGTCVPEYLPGAPLENGEECLLHRSQPIIRIARVEDDLCIWIGSAEVFCEETTWHVEDALSVIQHRRPCQVVRSFSHQSPR